MISRQPFWIAVLVLVAFVLAPVTVTFTMAKAYEVPKDAELVSQGVYADCESGPLLKYAYRKGDKLWIVYKAPNKGPAITLEYKLDADETGTLVAIYDQNEKLTRDEALARYPSPCAMIESKT